MAGLFVGEGEREGRGSGPFHVFAGAGVDLDLFAGLDEEGSLNGDTGFDDHGFLDVVRRVTADAFGGIGDGEDDAGGKFDGDGFFLDESDGDRGVFDQIIPGIADQFRGQGGGFEVVGVSKHEVFAVLVAELHLPGLHGNHLHLFRGAEPDVGGLAGLDASDGGLDEGAEVAGGAMLHFEDHGNVRVIDDGHSAAEIVG